MSKAVLFFGESNSNRLLAQTDEHTDAGVGYDSLLITRPEAPGGPSGEAIYTAVYLLLSHPTIVAAEEPGEDILVSVSLLVDGVESEVKTVNLRAVSYTH